MNSSLRERFGRAGRIQAAGHMPSGSTVALELRVASDRRLPKPIDAMSTLVRCGLTVLAAKRAIEAVVEYGPVVVGLADAADVETAKADLEKAGLIVFVVQPNMTTTPARA